MYMDIVGGWVCVCCKYMYVMYRLETEAEVSSLVRMPKRFL